MMDFARLPRSQGCTSEQAESAMQPSKLPSSGNIFIAGILFFCGVRFDNGHRSGKLKVIPLSNS